MTLMAVVAAVLLASLAWLYVAHADEPHRVTVPLVAMDGHHPTSTPTPTATATATPTPAFYRGQHFDEAGMRSLYAYAGVPAAWVEPLLTIAWCESRWRSDAVGDGSNSLGLHQLWSGWFSRAGYSVSQWDDPVVNTHVALYVREALGRFGGSGGWTCANIHGIW